MRDDGSTRAPDRRWVQLRLSWPHGPEDAADFLPRPPAPTPTMCQNPWSSVRLQDRLRPTSRFTTESFESQAQTPCSRYFFTTCRIRQFDSDTLSAAEVVRATLPAMALPPQCEDQTAMTLRNVCETATFSNTRRLLRTFLGAGVARRVVFLLVRVMRCAIKTGPW